MNKTIHIVCIDQPTICIIKSIFEVPKKRDIEDYIQEFEKAEILVKTVRLKENNLPSEDISFPSFEYVELVEEE